MKLMGEKPTISQYIDFCKSEMDLEYSTFFYKELISKSSTLKTILNDDSVIEIFLGDLDEDLYVIEFTDAEYYKYMYKPKLLSYDLYGTTELWFLILHANEMFSISEFDQRTIKLYNPVILQKLNEILNLEKDKTDLNAYEINRKLKGL